MRSNDDRRDKRVNAGSDLSNISVIIFGFEARSWLLLFMGMEFTIGLFTFIVFLIFKTDSDRPDTGLSNIIWFSFLFFGVWWQSKIFFSILSFLTLFDFTSEFYMTLNHLIIVLEVESDWWNDELIKLINSCISLLFAYFMLIVLFRLSCCNGLMDNHDLEKKAITEVIKEQGIFKCDRCDEYEYENNN